MINPPFAFWKTIATQVSSLNRYIAGDDISNGVVAVVNNVDTASPSIVWDAGNYAYDTDPGVECMVLSGTDLYIGGAFTNVLGETRNRLACLDANVQAPSVTLWAWNPDVDNDVRCMVLDGSTMYIGGTFEYFGNYSFERRGAGAVSSDKNTAFSLKDWNLNILWDRPVSVNTMIINGEDMYIGGSFKYFGSFSTIRELAACVSRNPDSPVVIRNWNPNIYGLSVRSLIYDVGDGVGDVIYIGGSFTQVNGITRKCLACVSANPNNPVTVRSLWNPNITTADGTTAGDFYDMIHVDGVLYVVGQFAKVAGDFGQETRNNAFAVSSAPITQALLLPWHPNLDALGYRLFRENNNIYIMGGFSSVNGASRNKIAVVEKNPYSVCDLKPWNPALSPGFLIRCMA